MCENNDKIRLEKVVEFCRKINKSIERFGKDFNIFNADDNFYLSVSYSILIVSNNLNIISDKCIEKIDDFKLLWHISNIGYLITHFFDETDKLYIWNVAINDIPILQNFCEETLKSYEEKQ
ncbi:MAG: hypothetical protein LBL80_04425 [Ruminococcus sp.]|jgi:uncharacterized protein with HEPN domain|nr:hypothetical protein [Ruminococcus sp.]